MRETTLSDGSLVTPDHAEIQPNGMQKGYVVLSKEERSKGFVRPVRKSYIHVGKRPKYPVRNLTEDEAKRFKDEGYVCFEEYPEGSRSLGRYWTDEEMNSGCGSVTTMSLSIAETYARDPHFYSGTFCSNCREHFDVGEDGEFIWLDNDESVYGERVGT